MIPILCALFVAGSLAARADRPPVYEPGFLTPIAPSSCAPESRYEAAIRGGAAAAYGARCTRLHFAFGPIHVKPGQNDVLIEPITIEKPAYEGYVVRIKPNMVDATGHAPPIIQVMLHHAVWLSTATGPYGSASFTGPFFATGEEKTIVAFPPGYGMLVRPHDVWSILYMVHNLTPTPQELWLTYDVDYVAKEDGDRLGIVPVEPIWLDVQRTPIHSEAPNEYAYPVFNVQRGFGHVDAETGRMVCAWPKENCARHDPFGGVTPQQGQTRDENRERIAIGGADLPVTADLAGTLVTIGGHLHPGGMRNEVSLVRGGVEKPVFYSDAVYWDRKDPRRGGGPMDSGDFAMTVSGATLGWKVKIREGDVIRLNALYDAEDASWYESMGIVLAWVAPDDPHGRPGLDVFDDAVATDPGVPTTAVTPPRWRAESCRPSATRLCLRGQVSHGHLTEASDFGGCPPRGCGALPRTPGPAVAEIPISDFRFGPADQQLVGLTGIPRVRRGEAVRFWNLDNAKRVWHTVTACAPPCTGATGLDYPLANARADLDSTQVGWGLFFEPASGQLLWEKPTAEALRDGAYWEFAPSSLGLYTFFCRVHPFMRGALEVVS